MTRAPSWGMIASRVVDGDPQAAASAVSLQDVTDAASGLSRTRSGKGFRYTDANRWAVRDIATLSRIRALAIEAAALDVDALRAIETILARYLDPARRRKHA